MIPAPALRPQPGAYDPAIPGAALEFTLDDYLVVRDRLIDLDLIAFDGTRFQVLSLPPAPSVRFQVLSLPPAPSVRFQVLSLPPAPSVPPPRPLVTQVDI
jgi:hypothetical protein